MEGLWLGRGLLGVGYLRMGLLLLLPSGNCVDSIGGGSSLVVKVRGGLDAAAADIFFYGSWLFLSCPLFLSVDGPCFERFFTSIQQVYTGYYSIQ